MNQQFSPLGSQLRDPNRLQRIKGGGEVKSPSSLPLDRSTVEQRLNYSAPFLKIVQHWSATRPAPMAINWPSSRRLADRRMTLISAQHKALRLEEIEPRRGVPMPSMEDLRMVPEAPKIPELQAKTRMVTGHWRRTADWSNVVSGRMPKSLNWDDATIRARSGRKPKMTTEDLIYYPRTAIPEWMPPEFIALRPGQPRTPYHDLADRYPQIWDSHNPSLGDRYIVPGSRWRDHTPRIVVIADPEAEAPRRGIWAPNSRQLLGIAKKLGLALVLEYAYAEDGTWAKWVCWVDGRSEAWVAEIEMDEAVIRVLLGVGRG